ncbi:hypothetical protein CAC42_3884 [Sphaceloma murrayae]|uniref:Uncharacterized protein n=1 Tax=Sphaceloma murrayae TaxID=2082308 RepID=A0A2K1QS92_9PEZI|nr:hypothetical protein CAC42_3884 [Sphaceloma murrayae]
MLFPQLLQGLTVVAMILNNLRCDAPFVLQQDKLILTSPTSPSHLNFAIDCRPFAYNRTIATLVVPDGFWNNTQLSVPPDHQQKLWTWAKMEAFGQSDMDYNNEMFDQVTLDILESIVDLSMIACVAFDMKCTAFLEWAEEEKEKMAPWWKKALREARRVVIRGIRRWETEAARGWKRRVPKTAREMPTESSTMRVANATGDPWESS